MPLGIVLMIALRCVKTLDWDYFSDDGFAKHFRLIQLCDISLGYAVLVGVVVKDHGAILGALIGPLPIEFRRIVSDREEYLQKLAVRDLRRIISDLHRLGVTGLARAHGPVLGSFVRTARIAGNDLADTLHVLKNFLHAPEASAGKNRSLLRSCICRRRIERRFRDGI